MSRIRFYFFTFHMDSLTFAVKYEQCSQFTLYFTVLVLVLTLTELSVMFGLVLCYN